MSFESVAIIFLIVLCGVYASAGIFLYLSQERLIFPRGKTPLPSPGKDLDGATCITLVTQDGVMLKSWFKAPVGSKPCIIYFHGNGGTLSDRAHRLRLFAEEGFGFLGVAYRGYAGNPGTPSETGLQFDALAAVAFARNYGIEPNRIVVYGESLGTYLAVYVAATQSVQAVILDAPFTSLADVAVTRYSYLPVRLFLKQRFDTLQLIPKITCPLLVMRGLCDAVVPADQSLTLFQKAPHPKKLWTLPTGNHRTLLESGGFSVVSRFLEKEVARPS